MIRYGVVGVGYFGADLACFMNEFDNAQITAVYDPVLRAKKTAKNNH